LVVPFSMKLSTSVSTTYFLSWSKVITGISRDAPDHGVFPQFH
jgi:hypothetical protein